MSTQSLIDSLRQRVHAALDHAIDEAVSAGQRTMAEKIMKDVGKGFGTGEPARGASNEITPISQTRKPRAVSKETRRKRVLQGQYMGLMRVLPKPVQASAKKLNKSGGIAKAIRFLKDERDKSKGKSKKAA